MQEFRSSGVTGVQECWSAGVLNDREVLLVAGSWLLAPASSDRNFLASQGLVHGDRKIASQLGPVLVASVTARS